MYKRQVSEEVMLEAILFGHEEIKKIIAFQEEIIKDVYKRQWLDSRQTEIKEEFVILDEMNNVIALYEPTGDGRYRPKIMF